MADHADDDVCLSDDRVCVSQCAKWPFSLAGVGVIKIWPIWAMDMGY